MIKSILFGALLGAAGMGYLLGGHEEYRTLDYGVTIKINKITNKACLIGGNEKAASLLGYRQCN